MKRGETYRGKECARCRGTLRYSATNGCVSCMKGHNALHREKKRWVTTKIEAELQAEAIVAYWLDHGARVNVVVEPIAEGFPGETWTTRITMPFNARGFPQP